MLVLCVILFSITNIRGKSAHQCEGWTPTVKVVCGIKNKIGKTLKSLINWLFIKSKYLLKYN